MDFFETVAARRSVRAFGPREVPDGVLAACLEAARGAPSASNIQPWRFLVVRGEARRAALAEAGYGQPALATAPVITVLLADRTRHRERLRRSRELIDCGALDPATLAKVKSGYAARDALRQAVPGSGERAAIRAREQAETDAGLAAGALLAGEHYALAAVAQGYATCWVGLFDATAAREAGGWPESCLAVAMLPTGVPSPDSPPLPPRPRLPLAEIAWREDAGNGWR